MVRSRTLVFLVAVLSGACFVDDPGPGEADASTGSTSTSTGSTLSTTTASAATGSSSSSSTSTSSSTTTSAESSSGDSSEGSESSSSTGQPMLTVAELAPGDLVITEMMGNPNCNFDDCEWFEVLNTTDLPIRLEGLGIGDRMSVQAGSAATTVTDSNAILEPGVLGVFAREESWLHDSTAIPVVRYSNDVQLSNGSFDTIALFNEDDDILDEAALFITSNDNEGRTRILRNEFWDVEGNDDSDHWCWSDTVLPPTSPGQEHWGTPGSDVVECLLE